jgi:Ca2+-binding EF-hand superfamily protein
LYFGEKRNNVIDKNILVNVIKDLGFKLSDDDINLVLDKVDCNLDLEKFTNIMKEIELNFRLKLNN